MDIFDDDIPSLKRKSTLELTPNEANGIERKSSRVHAIASVKAATRKLTSTGKQKSLSHGVGSFSSQRNGSSISQKGRTQKKTYIVRTSSSSSSRALNMDGLQKSHSKTSVVKSLSKTSTTKSLSKTGMTKSLSKTSITKSLSKTSMTKSLSRTGLAKSPSKTSMSKSPSKTSMSKSPSKTSLTKVVSTENGGKKLWFLRGSHVAVHAEDGAKFYLCRLQQNVFNSTKEVKVRWLSMAGVRFYPNIYRMSYLDKIDPASILMQVQLSQKSRLTYLLPGDEEEEINKMISLVKDVQNGKLSFRDIADDDVKEVLQIEEPPKKKPRLVKSASQRIRDKAVKNASKTEKAASKSPVKARKTPAKKPKEKVAKTKKLTKKEEEVKLNPRPDIKVLDKDPLFETREPMPYVSKISNSRLVFRAIHLGDAPMLKKLLKDGRKIKELYTKSVGNTLSPIEAVANNVNNEVLNVLVDEYVKSKFKKRLENNQYDPTNLHRLGTGKYDKKSLGVSRIWNIQASRGSKEGNNAFLNGESKPSTNTWKGIIQDLAGQGLSASSIEAIENYQSNKNPDIIKNGRSRRDRLIPNLLFGQNKFAGNIMKNMSLRRHYAAENLMKNVLLFDDEDLTQCPPSAVKEACKQLDGITAIHCAAVNPNSKYLAKLLSVEPNSQVSDKKGRRPIHFAAACSSPDTLNLLLKWRVNTHDTDTNLKIPLHYAILARRADNVDILIKHDKSSSTTDPNVIRYGVGGINRPMKNSLTPLHMAAELEDLRITTILLSHGASVNAKTNVGNFQRTPLHIAAQTGNLEIVKLLVKHGAVVEQKDRLGRTALLMACKNGATKVLSYLLHIGANPERADGSDNTPLHYAAAYGWYFTVKLLMEFGVNPNAANMWKITPLSIAYMKGQVGIVRELLSYSNISINQALNDGSTLLFHACESDLTQEDLFDQIQYLIEEKGALCNIKDGTGKTALFYLASADINVPEKTAAAHLQSIKIAQCLLDNGCDIHAVDDSEATALNEVLGNVSNCTLAEFLMKKGCQLKGVSDKERKWTLLHAINENCLSASTGLRKVMDILKHPKYIKDAKAMAKCYNENGYTPLLHLCSIRNHVYKMKSDPKDQSENEKHFPAYFKFLVEVLQSDINAVVAKKYFSPESILPQKDSDQWYDDTQHAGRTPLMLLLQYQSRHSINNFESAYGKIILHLIEQGSNLNIVDRQGLTPLAICTFERCIELIEYLGKQKSCNVNYEIKTRRYDYPHHPLFILKNFEVIQALLKVGCDPNVCRKDKRQLTFLHILIEDQQYSQVKRPEILKIIEQLELGQTSYDFNAQDFLGMTVLHYAARENPGRMDTSLELEYKLKQNGGKVGLRDKKGRTPLHYVFKKNKGSSSSNTDPTQLTQIMSKSMTAEEINTQDYNGKTALHLAAEIGATISCIYLLSLGDRKADISLYDKDGNTALTLAVLNGKDACAVALMQEGARLMDAVIELSKSEKVRRKKERKPTLYIEEDEKEMEEDDDDYGERRPTKVKDDGVLTQWKLEAERHLEEEVSETTTPLYKAAMKKGLQGVAMLVSQASFVKSGCAPLDVIKMAFETCHYNIAMDILCSQFDSRELRKLDKDGRNPLHLLALSCRFASNDNNSLIAKVAEFLIREKVPVDQKDLFGLYPAHLATMHRHFGLADLLKEHSTHFVKDPKGGDFSYLEAALWRIYSKTFDECTANYVSNMDLNHRIQIPLYPDLMETYLKGNKKDPDLWERSSTPETTALIVAIRCSPSASINQASILLKAGASCNLVDGNHVTPMMHAVMQNNQEFVKLLLNHDYPNIKDDSVKTPVKAKKNKPNTSIFRLKPKMGEEDSESDDSDSESSEDENEKEDEKEKKKNQFIKKKSDINLDAKDSNGRTALHYVASPLPEGTFDNSRIAFLLVKAGAKELKDKSGLTPYALALQTGALKVADMLKSLGHGKHEKPRPKFDRRVSDKDKQDGSQPLFPIKPDFRKDAKKVSVMEMEEDRSYVHNVDKDCKAKDGELLKDEDQDVWFDVLLTKVDVKRDINPAYNFYKMQLVQQSNPSLYILFTNWGRIGEGGQFQHTPFSDLEAAIKEFSKIFREKTGNKWTDVKNFEIKPRKYRLLDDSARLAPPKIADITIDIESKARSRLPDHLLSTMNKMMNPKAIVSAMQRIDHLNQECLPFGQLKRERLIQGRDLLMEIRKLIKEQDEIKYSATDDKKAQEPKLLEIWRKIAELSNEYFHVIPQKSFEFEDIEPLRYEFMWERHMQTVNNLLDYEVACQMLLAAMSSKDAIHPADYVYKCLDCKIELMQADEPMVQLILKYIYLNRSTNDKITGMYKIVRKGEAAKLEQTGLENRRLLFHGTNTCNVLSILSRGLMVQHPVHGYSFGNGIYFADKFSKSRGYSDNSGFMFLCEVALGKPKVVDLCHVDCKSDFQKMTRDDGANSLISHSGGDGEDSHKWLKLPSGVSIAMGNSSGNNREYVVHNPDQVCLRYLIKFEK